MKIPKINFKSKKVLLAIPFVLIIVLVLVGTGGKINGILPHHPIVLGLPMDPQYDSVTDIIPLGETINHANTPNGHPGIDFLWTKDTPIIAMADGIVTQTDPAEDSHGKFDVYVTSGLYQIHYDELDELAPNLAVGTALKKGDFIGYPQRKGHGLHLEFVIDDRNTKLFKKELCPMYYFDSSALSRINAIWAAAAGGSHADMKTRFPKICNGYYDGLQEPSWMLLK